MSFVFFLGDIFSHAGHLMPDTTVLNDSLSFCPDFCDSGSVISKMCIDGFGVLL